MNAAKKALLLVGSPKGLAKSTASRRAALLLDALQDRGFAGEKLHILAAVRSEEGRASLLSAAERADVVILATPLHVDSLPAPVIRAMEFLSEHRLSEGKPKRFLAMLNCGFPEASQNETALAICRRFAAAMGWEWAGGIAIGGTGISTASLQKAVALAAEALSRGDPVPEEAVALAAKPAMRTWLYILGGNLMWRWEARRNGVKVSLRARPYAHPKG